MRLKMNLNIQYTTVWRMETLMHIAMHLLPQSLVVSSFHSAINRFHRPNSVMYMYCDRKALVEARQINVNTLY